MPEDLINAEEWEMFKSMAEPAILAELVNEYLSDSPQLVEQMHQGLAAGDIELVRRAAHTLKSNSASFGGRRLAIISRELEMIAKGGTLNNAEPKLAEIEAEYSKLSARLLELKNEF
jgi:HPt (histidine-containing phosphotransfer) domain-containing protein